MAAPLEDLTRQERELIDAAVAGREFLCSDLEGAVLARGSEPGHQIRASLIRELLIGVHGKIDPAGLRVRGAHIVGLLDLDHLRVEVSLFMQSCAFSETISAVSARLRHLELIGSSLVGLDANGLGLEADLVLREAHVNGASDDAIVNVVAARVAGYIDCVGAQIRNSSGPAVAGDGMTCAGGFFLTDVTLRGAGQGGTLRLSGSALRQLELNDSSIRNKTGAAVIAGNIRVNGDVLANRLDARGAYAGGTVRLLGARVDGRVELANARLRGRGGPALYADGAQIGGDFFLNDARISTATALGAVRLVGALVEGQIVARGAAVKNSSGPALLGNRLHVRDDLVLDEIHVHGDGELGTVHLIGARLDADLTCADAEVINDDGPVFNADRLQVKGALIFDSLTAGGSGEAGAVRLIDAEVGGFSCDDARLGCKNGPALIADRIRVSAGMYLLRTVADGEGEDGAIRLSGASVAGQLSCDGLRVENPSGPVLHIAGARIGAELRLPADVICSGDRKAISCTAPGRARLDDLVYGSLAAGWRDWLHLISNHTLQHRPQPFQQLAAVERAAGHDGNARLILIAQQADVYRRDPRALGGLGARALHRLWGLLAGYGYRVRRLTGALALAVAAAGLLGLAAGHTNTRSGHHAAERTIESGSPAGTSCSTVELIGLGLDRGLPLGPTGLRAKCDLDTGTRRGQAFTIAVWCVQVVLLGLVTLALAGYTNLIRKVA